MANSKGPSTIRSMMYSGKNLLPPKSPFPSISSSYVDYVPGSTIGQKGIQKPKDGNSHHLRTSSESLLTEEQPSWLDDLLNEPETPVRRGHRRSSSDSFAYIDTSNAANLDYGSLDDNRFINMAPVPSWGFQEFDRYKEVRSASYYVDQKISNKPKSRAWDGSLNSVLHQRGVPSSRDNVNSQNSGLSCSEHEPDKRVASAADKAEGAEFGAFDTKGPSERKDSSHTKSTSDTDTKRAKQQFAQRSRVRKLQYIAELERNVQALQAEGSEVSAEIDFLNQQNLILSMENKALKQRLESLAQEQLIKYLEHEVLERERGRLRALYQQLQQQTQQQQQPSNHRRSSSRDLDQQLANLSLKQKEATTTSDPVPSQLQL